MDMNQLISQITRSTGASPDLAKQGIQMVGGFLKGKLPAIAGGQIDALVGGQTISTPQLSQAATHDQIAEAISQYTKLPESEARTIVQMAGSFLADHIPAPFGDQVNVMLGITGAPGGLIEKGKDVLGGFIGQKDQ